MPAADGPKGIGATPGGPESSADAAPQEQVVRGGGRGSRLGEQALHQPHRETTGRTSSSPSAQQLIDSCQGMVKTVAWSIHQRLPRHVELDDLIGYGQLGLAQAAETFRPERGKFGTFAFYRIRGAILDGLSKMSWFSRHEYHARRYEQLANEVLDVDARDKVASGTGLPSPEDHARWFRNVTGSLTVVYLATSTADDDPAQGDVPDTHSRRPDDLAMEEELRMQLRDLIDNLPQDAGNLIRMTYYEGMTMTEAAAKLGVSKSWASRLHARTLKRLAAAMNHLGARREVA